jgi:hypothetical protein
LLPAPHGVDLGQISAILPHWMRNMLIPVQAVVRPEC